MAYVGSLYTAQAYVQSRQNSQYYYQQDEEVNKKHNDLWKYIGLLDDVVFIMLAGRGKSSGAAPIANRIVGESAAAGKFMGNKGMAAMLMAGALLAGPMAGTVYAQNQYGLLSAAESKLYELEKAAEKEGIQFKVTEGYRSQARQDILYSQGRTKPGKQVTWVKKSKHTSRKAFDIAVIRGGKVTWEPKDYFRIGKLGESVGLTWGGEWKRRDLVHFELPDNNVVPIKSIQRTEHSKAFSKEVSKVMQKHRADPKKTAGLVNKVLHDKKTSSKMGTASYKAVNFIKRIFAR